MDSFIHIQFVGKPISNSRKLVCAKWIDQLKPNHIICNNIQWQSNLSSIINLGVLVKKRIYNNAIFFFTRSRTRTTHFQTTQQYRSNHIIFIIYRLSKPS